MPLVLHRGAEEVPFALLQKVGMPPATPSHVPIAHHRIVEAVKHSLTFYGHEIVEEHHALDKDGMRYFGLLTLRSPYGDYTDTVGLRNSHDKTFPIGISFGSHTFVCDNLSFSGDVVLRRKHTANAWRDVHGLIAGIIEPLTEQREAQHLTFDLYKSTMLDGMTADHAIMEMYRQDVINVQRIPEVIEQWERPTFDWGERTAFRLFNAATYALTGKVAEDPSITQRLHSVIDGICQPMPA